MRAWERKWQQIRRVRFVGCTVCGAVDRTLRNMGFLDPKGKYIAGKICPECLKKKEEEDHGKDR